MHGMQESSGGICTSECTHHGTIRRVCIAHFTVRYEGARQPHGGCWRRLAAGRLCGRCQSSTNTMDGMAGLSSGGSGRHGRSQHNLIGRVCRQRMRRLWPGSFANRRCAFAAPFNEGCCHGSLAFLVNMKGLGAVAARCPRPGAMHSVEWVRRAACGRRVLFVSLCMIWYRL